MIDTERYISLSIPMPLFEKVAAYIIGACNRIGCTFSFCSTTFPEGASLMLSVTSRLGNSDPTEAKEMAALFSIPFLHIYLEDISGETFLYEMLVPYFSDGEDTIDRILRLQPHNVADASHIQNSQVTTSVNEIIADTESSGRKFSSQVGILFTLLSVILVVGIVMYVNKSKDMEYLRVQLYETENVLSNVANVAPLVIKDLQVANKSRGGEIETDYAEKIKSSTTMFLTPKVYYVGLSYESVSLDVKLYNKWGNLSRGEKSPAAYSYSDTISVTRGNGNAELIGWGNENQGYWSAGNYRYELWYKGRCLYVYEFTIY